MAACFGFSFIDRMTRSRTVRDNRGAAAVEFALLGAPFFLLIMGLIEISLIFIASSMLDNAAGEAGRQIRTGEVQQRGDDATAFRALVCDELAAVVKCDSGLKIDVRTFSSFSATTFVDPIDEDTGDFAETETFQAGGSSQIVVVRVFYEWKLITPMIGIPLGNMSSNRRLLQSTVVFRNEPF